MWNENLTGKNQDGRLDEKKCRRPSSVKRKKGEGEEQMRPRRGIKGARALKRSRTLSRDDRKRPCRSEEGSEGKGKP